MTPNERLDRVNELRARARLENLANRVIPADDPVVATQGMGITGPPVAYPASERQRASYEAYLRTLRADYAAYRAKYLGGPL